MRKTIIAAACIFATAAHAQVTNATGWTVDSSTSMLDGGNSYVAGKNSEQLIVDAFGSPQRPMLAVQCVGGDLRVMLSWPTYLGHPSREVDVDSSADGGQVRSWYFVSGGNGGVALLQGRRDFKKFATFFAGAHEATFRVYAHADTQEATFSLVGFQDVVNSAMQACGD